jgi:hypothetical protein
MRRALLAEQDIDRLVDLAHSAGVSLRLAVDLDGEATFVAAGLGTFNEVKPLERTLSDAARAAA